MKHILEILHIIISKLLYIAFIYAFILVMIFRFFGNTVEVWFKNKYLLIITIFFVGCLLIWLTIFYLRILGFI